MSGVAWALIAGAGFGLFQSFNRPAVRQMSVPVSTFLQILISAVLLAAIASRTENLTLLRAAPPVALLSFTAAGFIHFFVGWTLLNVSQKRIGAARTSPLTSTVPLFGTIIAALTIHEIPGALGLLGVATVVAGVYIVSADPNAPQPATPHPGWRGSIFGLGTALCWSVSPFFIRIGLQGLPSPLLGLTFGMIASAIAYAIALIWQREPFTLGADPGSRVLVYKTIAGVLVGLSQWARWIALGLAPIGIVLALQQISVPVTIVLAPLIAGRHLEHVTARVWAGALTIIGGSLILIFTR